MLTKTFVAVSLFFYISELCAGQIRDIQIKNLTEDSVVISFTTSPSSTAYLKYGENKDSIFNQAISIGPVTNHSITLRNLSPGTVYFFYIEATFPYSNINPVKTSVDLFKTKGLPLFRIINFEVVSNLLNKFVVSWTLTRKGRVTLYYIEDGTVERKKIEELDFKTEGFNSITNIKQGKTYLYFAEFSDESGKIIKTKVFNIKIPEENIAKGCFVTGTFTNFMKEDPFFDLTSPVIRRITDERLTWFDGTAISGNINLDDQFCIIDLKKERIFSRIEVFWRSLSLSTNFSIELSKDCKNWTLIKDSLDGRKGEPLKGENGDPLKCNVITFQKPVIARFVKLTAKKGSAKNKHERWNFVQLTEIKIFP